MLNFYLNQIGSIPLLSNEEQINLLQEYAKTKSASIQKKIVRHNLRLVVSIAKKYHVSHGSLMDLIQEGNTGLVRAVEKFSLDANVKFSTYASYWIKARILRYIIDNAHIVKIGTTQAQRKLFFSMRKLKKKFEAQGIEPTVELLAKELGVDKSSVNEMNERLSGITFSLSNAVDTNDDESYSYTAAMALKDESSMPNELFEKYDLRDKINKLMKSFCDSLEKKDYQIVFSKRFMKDIPENFNIIGAECGFSRQRAQQIESLLKPRFRNYLVNNGIYSNILN